MKSDEYDSISCWYKHIDISFMTRNSLLQRRTTIPDFGATTSPWCSPSTAFHVSKSRSTCKCGKWGRDSHPHICGNIKGFITAVSSSHLSETFLQCILGCVWLICVCTIFGTYAKHHNTTQALSNVKRHMFHRNVIGGASSRKPS